MRTWFTREWSLGLVALGVVTVGTLGCHSEAEVGTPEEDATLQSESAEPVENSSPALLEEKTTDHQKISALTEALVGKSVVIQGEIVRQCPASGCWFQVKDETGELFVDLNASEIRLTDPVVGQQAEVSGRLVKLGGELQLEAKHVDFAPKK